MGATRARVTAVMISALLAGSCARLAFGAQLDQSAPPLDRYGGGRHYMTQASGSSVQTLTWAGKVDPSAQGPLATATMSAQIGPSVINRSGQETVAPSFENPKIAIGAAAPDRPWSRASTDPSMGADARLYSVHREFGLTPDPIPAPPLTFTGGADLAADDAAAAAPQPNRNTAAGRTAITQDRINESGDGQP